MIEKGESAMHKILMLSIALASVVFLSGCITSKITPTGSNSYSSVTVHDTGYPIGAAKINAEDYCKKQGKKTAVITHEEKLYNGNISENTKDTLNLISALAGGSSTAASLSNDYEVRMKFKCR